MIINNFRGEKNYKDTPDIILYPGDKIKLLTQVEGLIEDVTTEPNQTVFFFSENAYINYKNYQTCVFPKFLEHIKKKVEKKINLSFNSCLIQKGNWSNFNQVFGPQDQIIPFIMIGGSEIKLNFKNIQTGVEKSMDIKDGSLLVQRENVWNIMVEEGQPVFYTLIFLDIYIEPVNILKKKLRVSGKLSYSLPIIYLSTKQRILLKEKIYKGLENVHINPDFPEGKQCIMKDGSNKLNKYINIKQHIGSGNWGNVYSACLTANFLCKRKFCWNDFCYAISPNFYNSNYAL